MEKIPTAEITVDEVMRRWPCTIRIFIDFNMHCVGCPIATFHSVEEACREHAIDLAVFLQRLQAAVQTSQRSAEEEWSWPSASPNSL
jgi:hybrid cluster-associated redox disulfide protein